MAQQCPQFTYHNIQILREQMIGQGAYGTVYKCMCDDLPCAAKIVHPQLLSASPKFKQDFYKECELLSSAKHPNIIQYLGTHFEGPGIVLLMELMQTCLTKYLEKSPDDSLPYHIQVNICHDVLLALSYLHSNDVIHRDLNSNNVLLNCGNLRAKITDFGVSKWLDSRFSRLTQAPGCVAYMSPEALTDNPNYTSKLDIFSFGVLAIQIVTKKFPLPGPSKRKVTDEKYPLPIEVPILEIERRSNHIKIIEPSHPLKNTAMECLEYHQEARPSAPILCSHVAALKANALYHDSIIEYERSEAQRRLSDGDSGKIDIVTATRPNYVWLSAMRHIYVNY